MKTNEMPRVYSLGISFSLNLYFLSHYQMRSEKESYIFTQLQYSTNEYGK